MSLPRVLLLALSEAVPHVQLLRGMSGPELKFLRGKIQGCPGTSYSLCEEREVVKSVGCLNYSLAVPGSR